MSRIAYQLKKNGPFFGQNVTNIDIGNGSYDVVWSHYLGTSARKAIFDKTNGRVRFQLGSASKYVDMDAVNAKVTVEDVDQYFGDNDSLIMGDGSDFGLVWNGSYLASGPASGFYAGMPSKADPQYPVLVHEFFDDFHAAPLDAAQGKWLEVDDSATGTNATADAAGGWGTVVTAAADNDHHAITSLNECFLFAVGKKLWFEARFALTEATTDESAWWFGLSDTLTTGGFQANAAGPLASYDGALIWKDEDTLAIDFETSNAATQATATAQAVFASGITTRVGFYFDGAATTGVITPYYDVDGAGWVAGTAKNITLAGLEEMHVVAGVKAGPTAAAETLKVDYVRCVQLR